MKSSQLSLSSSVFLFLGSLLIVGFGQPAWVWWLGLIGSSIGFALIWRVLLNFPLAKHRFWIGTLWMMAVQMVQLSWMISHPFLYIYGVYLFLAFVVGLQFGLLSLFITPKYLGKFRSLLFIACGWVLMEWCRLFFLSGFSWNPVGLALAGNLYSMQFASFWGIFGLSFWVMIVNLLALRTWSTGYCWKAGTGWVLAALLPFLFGVIQLSVHEDALDHHENYFTAVMVQPAFPAEEAMEFSDARSFIAFVEDEWKQILSITKQHHKDSLDLIVLPEFVVPLGSHSFMYPAENVHATFLDLFGEESLDHLPTLEHPLALEVDGKGWYVSNAYWAQAMANTFSSSVVVGLEDAEDIAGERQFYSAALFFEPNKLSSQYLPRRYEKRVLVPMGEYLPFSFVKALAAQYGVTGSFTPGLEAKVFEAGGCPFGLSICYEETFADLTRENRQKGAEMLVNLTSDVWYPNSRLPQQHFDHSRLRAVESGIPLIRACNTGVTGAVDSLGRVVAILGENHPDPEWLSDSIQVKVPRYHYNTLYSHLGDSFIIGFSLLMTLLFFRTRSEEDS